MSEPDALARALSDAIEFKWSWQPSTRQSAPTPKQARANAIEALSGYDQAVVARYKAALQKISSRDYRGNGCQCRAEAAAALAPFTQENR